MTDALVRSRDAVTSNTGDAAHRPYGCDVGANDDAMRRWEPWVRAYVVLQELLEPLAFESYASAGGTSPVNGLRLCHRIGNDLVPLMAISRPEVGALVKQIPLVLDWAELREERMTEILAQIDPQYAFWSQPLSMRPDRNRWTFELINVVLQFCVHVEMRFKHELAVWRPVDLSAEVQPMITTPGHGSFPMGHATQTYAVVEVLKALCAPRLSPKAGDQLDRLAARISINRVIAGVHYPIDATAGRLLGQRIGKYLIARATNGVPKGTWVPGRFEGADLGVVEAFDTETVYADSSLDPKSSLAIPPANKLNFLWNLAKVEQ